LTLADVSTTSPTALTSWKARMLEDFTWRPSTGSRGHGGGRPRRVSVSQSPGPRAGSGTNSDAFIQEFLAAMPERYLYSNTPETVARHAALAQQALGSPILVACLSTDGSHLELAFVAEDRPGLLA